jgi:CHAD domain-containing protein
MKARRVEGLDPATPLQPNAARLVRVRLDELRSFAPIALEPAASKTQHDMRIAAKRLRYVLEIVGPCFGPEADAARIAAKRLQSVLGEIHDCDVMLPRVWGIASTRERLRGRREELFREFAAHWREQAERGTWAKLGRSLDRHTFSLQSGESGSDREIE